MKRTILFALLFLLAPSLWAQTTSVSGTVTDAGGVLWKNGTFSFTFRPSPSNPTANYFQNGVPFNKNQVVTGSLDGTASFAGTAVPDNQTIIPAGSQWTVQFCPLATATNGCYSTNLTITGGAQNITASINPPAIVVSLSNPPVGGASAYTDGEIFGARVGSFYFNLTDNTPHFCQLPVCTWVSVGPGTFSGSLAVNQVAFGTGANTIGGSANFLYNSTVANAINLNMPGASCTGVGVNQHGCSLLALTNSSAATPFYVGKYADNSICFTNDDNAIPSHGQWCLDTNGNYFVIAGGVGTQMQLTGNAAGGLTAGSVTFQLPPNAPHTTLFSLNQSTGVSGAATYQWNSFSGVSSWFPNNATLATVTLTPPASGSTVTAVALELTATSAAFATATTAGTCVQNTTAVTGATTSMVPIIAPVSTPGVGAIWSAFVSSAGNVTINECAVATSAGGTIAFNIRVIE